MDPWPTFVRDVLARHGVSDVRHAAEHGVSEGRFFDRTAREGWSRPVPGVRVHPQAATSVQQQVLVVCRSSADVAGASREVAAWLHGLRDRPPVHPTVLGQHATRCAAFGDVQIHRARWLSAEHLVEVDRVPTLTVAAMFISSLGTPVAAQRRRLIDALHRELTTADALLELLDALGPLTGKHVLRQLCRDLARRRVESIFQEEVAEELARLGYRPERSTRRIPTADGVGIDCDVPLPWWQVSVEPSGDAYHRGREQRRADRRRAARFAGTTWVQVPVDWRDWHLERDRVLDAIEGAIAVQRARGIGADHPPPARRGRRSLGRVIAGNPDCASSPGPRSVTRPVS